MLIKKIGFVESSYEKPMQGYDYEFFRKLVSRIHILPEFTGALERIGKEKYVYVLYWMDRVTDRETTKVHPRGDMSRPLTGVFATRSPRRPNPIGLSVVELLEVKGNILEVRGLDALDGSPVLDIKAYRQQYVPWSEG